MGEPIETVPEVVARLQYVLDRTQDFEHPDGWWSMPAPVEDAIESTLATLTHLRCLMEAKRSAEDQIAEIKAMLASRVDV